jgi:hypothetical protein
VFYHLGELDSALTYALGAGALFDLGEDSEYVRTLVGEARLGRSVHEAAPLERRKRDRRRSLRVRVG